MAKRSTSPAGSSLTNQSISTMLNLEPLEQRLLLNAAPTLTTMNVLGGGIEDTPMTITYAMLTGAGNEADTDHDALSFRIEAISSGTLTMNGGDITEGSTLISTGDEVVWTPSANANGNLTAFSVVAWDGTAASATAVPVKVAVATVNDTPTLTAISTLTGATEDTAFTISYSTLAGAADEADVDGQTLSFRIQAVSSGTLTKNSVAVVGGTTLLSTGESLVWTPAANANGVLNAFTVVAWDGAAASASAIQVKASVAAANDAPTLTTMGTLSGATEDTPFTITYEMLQDASNMADTDSTGLMFRIQSVTTGTLLKAGAPVSAGSTTVAAGESVVWTPAANANGVGLNAFKVRAFDGLAASSADVQVKVSVAAVPDAPTLTTISNLTGATEDTAFTISYASLLAASNAADVDGNTISFRIDGVSSGTLTKGGVGVVAGTTRIAAGDSLTWTPAANANGTLAAFTVRAYDGTYVSSTPVMANVVVAAVNDAPTLTSVAILKKGIEDTPYTITYAALAAAADEADVDLGQAISFRVEAVSTGTLTKGGAAVVAGTTLLSSGGTLVWTPAANANGTLNAFTIKAWDGTAASATAVQVKVSVAPVNDAPTLTTISALASGPEDTLYTITYAALAAASNKADVDSGTVNFRIESVNAGGTLTKGGSPVVAGVTTLAAGESLVWTPAANANGATVPAFMVKAWDGTLASSTAVQVNVALTAVNDAPTLSTISTLTGGREDTAFSITYATLAGASNIADVDGTTPMFRVEAVSTGTLTKNGTAVVGGTTTLGSGESLVWTPASNANGTVNAFTVKAYDGTLASSTAVQVKVAVAAVNDAPTLTTISTLTGATEDTPFTITYETLAAAADEADVDSSPVSFRIDSVTSGTLTKGGVAVVAGTTLLAAGEKLVWTPAANANAAVNAFKVVAWDGAAASATAVQVAVNAAAVNDRPTLTAISTLANATEDTAYTISYASLLAAADEADVDGDTVQFRIESVSTGTLTKGGTAVTPGTTTITTGDSLVWTPAANANGTLNAFTVRAFDGSLASTSAVQVKVTTAAVNDAPTLTTITPFASGTEDTAYTISYASLAAAANEADIDSNPVNFRIAAVTSGTLTKGATAVTAGTTTLAAGESVTWTPAANANGLTNAFTVTAWDGAAASATPVQVKVYLAPVNDAPTLTTVTALTGATEDTPLTITYASLASAADEADVDGDTVSFRIEAVSTGSLTKNGVAVTPGSTMISTGDSVVWTPAANANGTLNAFTIKASDGALLSSTAIQVKAVVTAVNDAPTLTNVNTLAGNAENTAYTIGYAALSAAANAADVDGDAIKFRIQSISSGTLTKSGAAVVAGTTTIGTSESLIWTPAQYASGALNAFTVVAYDGTLASAPAVQVKVNVTPANHAPTLTTIATLPGGTEDTPYTISYALLKLSSDAADVDSDAISFRVETLSTGTLTKGGVAVTPGTTTIAAGESLVWTPAANANGALNAFTVKAFDGVTASTTAAVQVKVDTAAVDDGVPTLTTIATLPGGTEDTALTISYDTLRQASDLAEPDPEQAVSFRIESVASGTLTKGGAAVIAGVTTLSTGESVVWTPAANANGTGGSALTAFTVKAVSGAEVSAAAVAVKVNVAAVNDVPTLTSINTLAGGTEDTVYNITYAALLAASNAADVEGSTLSFQLVALSSGTLMQSDGTTPVNVGDRMTTTDTWKWTPAANANGTLTAFTVKAYDGTALSATAVPVIVSVANVNDVPTLTTINNLAGGTEDTTMDIGYDALLAASNAADVDGDALSFAWISTDSGTLTKIDGTAVAGGDRLAKGQTWRWTPAANANGTGGGGLGAFSVKAYDGTALSAATVAVKVDVAAVNDAPTLTTINTLPGATEDTAFTISYATLAAAADEADIDSGAISFRIDSVTSGTLTKGGVAVVPGTTPISVGDSVTWTPAANANGALGAFTVRAWDGAAASSTAVQVNVTVAAVNDAPTLTTITPLLGAYEDTTFDITYASLLAASNAADVDGDPISFAWISTSSGTLTQSDGTTPVGSGDLLAVGQTWKWTPAANANGTGAGALSALTVKASDGTLLSAAPVTVKVSTTAVNDAPTLTTITTLAGATEDTPFNITYATLAGAADEADVDGDTLSFRVEAISSGTLYKSGVAVTAGTLVSSNDTLVWTPAADANGTLNAFTVKAWDGLAASSTAVQVKVTTAAVNDAPTLTTINTLTGSTESTTVDITYAALLAASNAADVEGDTLSFEWVATSSGTLTKADGTTPIGSGDRLAATQTWKWTPAANAYGTGANALNAFTVKAYDGTTDSTSAVQVKVAVTEVEHAPTLTAITTLTGGVEDTPFQITYEMLANAGDEADVDGDTLSFQWVATSSGTLKKSDGTAVGAGDRLASGQAWTWTPAANANGAGLSAFTVKAYDGTLTSAAAIAVKVDVAAVQDAPVLTTITKLAGATEDTAFNITYASLLAASNLSGPDAGDTLSFRIESVSSGTLTKGGVAVVAGSTLISSGDTVVWTPAPNANGSGLNAFTVRGWDGAATSNPPVQVTVDVAAVNDAPTLSSVAVLTGGTEDTPYTVTFENLAAASDVADVDGDPLSFVVTSVDSGALTKNGVAVVAGTTKISAGESLLWMPVANANGTIAAFKVKAADAALSSATAVQVSINLAAVNDAPTMTTVATLLGASANTPFNITYAALLAATNAADVDGDTLKLSIESISSGTLTLNGQAVTAGVTKVAVGDTLVWTPATGVTGVGVNAFMIRAWDGSAFSSAELQVKVTVT